MDREMILLRAVDGSHEGWRWMVLDEFLQRISLDAWDKKQVLVGMVLPASGRATPN